MFKLFILFEFKKISSRTTRDDDVDDFEKFFPNKVSVVLLKNALKEFLFRMTTETTKVVTMNQS